MNLPISQPKNLSEIVLNEQLQEIKHIYVDRVADESIRNKNSERIAFVAELQERQRNQDNRAEKRFAKKLANSNIEYKQQYFMVCANQYSGLIYHIYLADFFIPELNLNIEIDGESHKSEYDARRDESLNLSGYEVLHLKTNTSDIIVDIIVQGIANVISE